MSDGGVVTVATVFDAAAAASTASAPHPSSSPSSVGGGLDDGFALESVAEGGLDDSRGSLAAAGGLGAATALDVDDELTCSLAVAGGRGDGSVSQPRSSSSRAGGGQETGIDFKPDKVANDGGAFDGTATGAVPEDCGIALDGTTRRAAPEEDCGGVDGAVVNGSEATAACGNVACAASGAKGAGELAGDTAGAGIPISVAPLPFDFGGRAESASSCGGGGQLSLSGEIPISVGCRDGPTDLGRELTEGVVVCPGSGGVDAWSPVGELGPVEARSSLMAVWADSSSHQDRCGRLTVTSCPNSRENWAKTNSGGGNWVRCPGHQIKPHSEQRRGQKRK